MRAGEHLPLHRGLRAAEQARLWVSVALIAVLLLAIEANRSAGRQALSIALVGAAALLLF
ncbi:hypothetical protein CLV63_14118 [Murinocardiopsis flavida]|uniref:Uncharacterized protein n=1 Tax=Murinocardiopsis flavida TaxID=645275 RepID=A0A2P8CDQ4_9ACTN|nr:hypothetical protein [Murinocardiopsis flavida]PSK83052.1 hypothetical protein CLV63_14118 [Murinocardiopsis flavida]